MTVDTIIEQAGIPLLLLVICVYYAIRLIVLHDSGGDHNLYGDSRHSLEADGGSVRRLNE